MLPYRDSTLTRIALIAFFVLVLGYGYFEARGFLLGPSIDAGPAMTVVQDPFIHIKGQAERIASLSMNGKAITVTEDGSFDEPYLLAEGLNRIVFDAKDAYGRGSQRVIQVVYEPPAATITTPTTSPYTVGRSATTSATTSPAVP